MVEPETTTTSEVADDGNDEVTSEAQAQIIASLRGQVTDLFSQVTQLNSKLVASYDRVSNLEDQLHDASSSLRKASVTISSLELERSHHLAALNTGLLVEKAHVTTELNRLMERATEEAAQRGQAETARRDIEKDLDDLSASLFDQANTMVAEARLGQAKSERKVQDAEQALKIAEDAVKDMQVQMQSLQAEKETAERSAQEVKLFARKGKWVERDDSRVAEVPRIRFMALHTPYTEFIAFVAHLRGLRASLPTPPIISTLLSQPFVARLLTEDSEPTVRLDLAPSLNWLSRRSVLAAIHTGMLTVEPVAFSNLAYELHQHPQLMSTPSLSCALCGTLIARLPSASPVSRSHNTNGGSWFKYPLALGSTQNYATGGISYLADCELPGQVYIFRLATPTASTTPPALMPVHTSSASTPVVGTSSRPPLNSLPPSRVLQAQTQNSPYPLCTSNYCLTRLRSTCSLWAFVRVGIMERIWEEEVAQPSKPSVNRDAQENYSPLATSSVGNRSPGSTSFSSACEKPPVPPRRRRLWEMASALGERAVSWGKEGGENSKDKEKETEKDGARRLLIPPSHPSAPHHHAESPISRVNAQGPPPLPKRNVIRGRSMADAVVPLSGIESGTDAQEIKTNSYIELDKPDDSAADSSIPVGEITFAAPTSESLIPPSTMPQFVATEPSAQPGQDPLPPPSPHTIPLPITPMASDSISRAASPVSRSHSRLSSPASPPSRPTSPAVIRSRMGSPSPTIARATSPSPGNTLTSQIRGKNPMAMGLGSSRQASPAPATRSGAPPLPRRAAARRSVLPPPTSGAPKVLEEGAKEGSSLVVTAIPAVLVPEADGHKVGEAEAPAETKRNDGEGQKEAETDVVREAQAPQATPVPTFTMETGMEPAKDITVGNINTEHGVEGIVNGTSATVALDSVLPRTSEGEGRASMDTTSTKQSSSTEGEGFVGDATWEERTWKELVKLKEDMFWARIGGVRVPLVLGDQ